MQNKTIKVISKCSSNPNGIGHFWKCKEQNGPTSESICKYCGEKTEIINSPTDAHCQTIVIGGVPEKKSLPLHPYHETHREEYI